MNRRTFSCASAAAATQTDPRLRFVNAGRAHSCAHRCSIVAAPRGARWPRRLRVRWTLPSEGPRMANVSGKQDSERDLDEDVRLNLAGESTAGRDVLRLVRRI